MPGESADGALSEALGRERGRGRGGRAPAAGARTRGRVHAVLDRGRRGAEPRHRAGRATAGVPPSGRQDAADGVRAAASAAGRGPGLGHARPRRGRAVVFPLRLLRRGIPAAGPGAGAGGRDGHAGDGGRRRRDRSARSFDAASRHVANPAGVDASPGALQRRALALDEAADRSGREEVLDARPLEPRMYLSIDGTGVPMRREETEGVRGRQADGTSRTGGAKLTVVYTAEGREPETGAAGRSPAGPAARRRRPEAGRHRTSRRGWTGRPGGGACTTRPGQSSSPTGRKNLDRMRYGEFRERASRSEAASWRADAGRSGCGPGARVPAGRRGAPTPCWRSRPSS